MRIFAHLGALSLVAISALSGCRLFTHDMQSRGKSPLRPAQASPDSTTMEIIWLRFPANDPEINGAAWQDIDETKIEPSVRRELVNNGFRVGVVSGALPEAIAHALGSGDPSSDVSIASSESSTSSLEADPIVHGRVQQLRRNMRSEIQASEVYPSVPVLVNDGRELSGNVYQQAQAIYGLEVDPQSDRTVKVVLTPELHHGPIRTGWTRGADDAGILRLAPQRDHEVFTQLRMSVKLAPGELLVLMNLPDSGSRLGSYFHTVDSAEGRQQKLILIRLAEVPASNTFAGLESD